MHIHFYTFTGNPDGTNHIRGIEYKYVLEERYKKIPYPVRIPRKTNKKGMAF